MLSKGRSWLECVIKYLSSQPKEVNGTQEDHETIDLQLYYIFWDLR